MKRVRLDIGAFNASPCEGGGFMFFLYREGMDKCLPVSLTPPEMHALLANFKGMEGNAISPQGLFYSALQDFKVELLEITIERQGDGVFVSRLLLFDGEREVLKPASFTDGVILAKLFGAPIYISEVLMERYSTVIDIASRESLTTESYVEKLKEELQQAIGNEDYERAAELSKKIRNFEK